MIWVVYYENNEKKYEDYKKKVDFIDKKSSQNFKIYIIYITKYKEIQKYDRFFILDDDIVINTSDINKMFEVSKKYKLWICQPSFGVGSKHGEHTKNVKGAILRYTNFIEVNTPLYTRWALNRLMKYYTPKLIGWGVDYLSMWAASHMYKNTCCTYSKMY